MQSRNYTQTITMFCDNWHDLESQDEIEITIEVDVEAGVESEEAHGRYVSYDWYSWDINKVFADDKLICVDELYKHVPNINQSIDNSVADGVYA